MLRSGRLAYLLVPAFAVIALGAHPVNARIAEGPSPLGSQVSPSVNASRAPLPFAFVPRDGSAVTFAVRPTPSDGSAHVAAGGGSDTSAPDLGLAPAGAQTLDASRVGWLRGGPPRAPPALPLT
jgi:hypothetical protein